MQGPTELDLAKTLADEHLTNTHNHHSTVPATVADRMRSWAGHRLIAVGERLSTRPTELQLKVSTGPPCP